MALVPISRRNGNGLSRLHNEMDDLFDGFFRGLDRPFSGYKAWPAIDVADKRVIRFRTFSKAYGMAGARVGYAIAHEDIATAFNKVRNHFGVNRIAQAGALAALADQDYLASVVAQVATAYLVPQVLQAS